MAYPSPKFNNSEQLKEIHAALVQRVPYILIDEFCEDLVHAEEPTPQPNNS